MLEDIIDSAQKILQYTKGLSFEEFSKDNKTVDAVIRNFEIIGEASNLLSDELKDKYSYIDWYRIRGFRNRIVHDLYSEPFSVFSRLFQEIIRVSPIWKSSVPPYIT